MSIILDSKIPSGPLAQKWSSHKSNIKVVNPANKRKYDVIVVGTGLAGASASASLAELGYNVKTFCVQDSPRRAHSIAAQGGINAAKNYMNDGDSVYRLFYDTIKGGDYRSREANVHRLAECSAGIIDQCVAQGVPFAREYSGELANRSFGGTQVSRTFYARGQTGQQLLIGAYQAMMRQVELGRVKLHARTEMLDLVLVNGKARGIITRDLTTGEITRHAAHTVILATGGYGRIFYLSTNAWNSNCTAIWQAHKRGAAFSNPCFTQIHPTCIPVSGDHQSKLTLMSESLRNDGRVWTPKRKEDIKKDPSTIKEEDRDYYLERKYPSFGNLVPRDIASRAAKEACDAGLGVGTGRAVYLDFRDAIKRDGEKTVADKYGNLFDMYSKIVDENPYQSPMKIYPAVHYTMGGLWVDYNLMSNIPGLHVLGEANFSDHGANRLGASALMQGLCDGYFVIPYTIGDYLASQSFEKVDTNHPEFKASEEFVNAKIGALLKNNSKATKTTTEYFRELGLTIWDHVGMSRNETGLKQAITKIQNLRNEFWENLKIGSTSSEVNKNLELASKVADFLELGELMARDALMRKESCGGHFREESQSPDGEALRDDANYSFVSAWEFKGVDKEPVLHKEPLIYENIKIATRSYK
ncbi:MAG: fumarate reductase/succinate dehydrogenase flavoprotein subunit [Xanthomonadaceae bacterium]|nr:fumarate reductase/succinate dehydrogenase flavoprotein subunit [Xanthomonadaceae bacterium]